MNKYYIEMRITENAENHKESKNINLLVSKIKMYRIRSR